MSAGKGDSSARFAGFGMTGGSRPGGGQKKHVAAATHLCCNSNMEVKHERSTRGDFRKKGDPGVRARRNPGGGARADSGRGARGSFELQRAAIPVLLGGNPGDKEERGAALHGAGAGENGDGAGRRGGGHRVVANDRAKPVGMDAQRRIQRNPDFQGREESEPGEMVFYPRMVRDAWGVEMGDFPADSFLEDDWDAAGDAAGAFQMGDEERIAGLRKPDDRGGSAGIEHVPHGRV